MNKHWAAMMPASFAGAVAFPMLLQGILHMPSLPVLVMIFVGSKSILLDVHVELTLYKPIIYAAESLVLFVCCSPSRCRTFLPLESIGAATASGIVLYNEYRLMVPGLIWGVTSLLLMGLSRACFVIASERSGADFAAQSRSNAYHGFTIMTLVLGMIISGTFSLQAENSTSIYTTSRGVIFLLLINMIAFIGAAFSGMMVLAYSPISIQEGRLYFSSVPVRPTDIFATTGASILILIGVLYSELPSYVSWMQIFAYFLSISCLLGAEQIHSLVVACMDNTQQRLSFRKDTSAEPRKPTRIFVAGILFFFLIFLTWSISSLESASIDNLTPSLPTKLDYVYEAQTRFDIVVSMYQEDAESVKQMLDKIKATTMLRSIKPRVILYTKDSEVDLDSLKRSTGADVVERLDNRGREGGTYLWHIVNKWDELAQQTMFIQAHAHNMRELIPRIDSYLVPSTGMLSLGFTGTTCFCDTCGDRFNWEDNWGVVPTLFESIYEQPCTSSTPPILLAYKGQFVASAQRIRGIEPRIYERLLRAVTSIEDWGHNEPFAEVDLGGVTVADSPSNPHFGFIVERIWSLLMQCGTDSVVAAKCPSLLSGMGVGGSIKDCQCLDG